MKTLNINQKYHQGYYRVQNPDKYVGDVDNVMFRSSIEKKFMIFCDSNEKIKKWGSEVVVVKYYFPVDKKTHDYYIDFFIVLEKQQQYLKYLVEIKPESSLIKPILNEEKKNNLKAIKNFQYSMMEYLKNYYKWNAAKLFAKEKQCEFIVITDKMIKKSL